MRIFHRATIQCAMAGCGHRLCELDNRWRVQPVRHPLPRLPAERHVTRRRSGRARRGPRARREDRSRRDRGCGRARGSSGARRSTNATSSRSRGATSSTSPTRSPRCACAAARLLPRRCSERRSGERTIGAPALHANACANSGKLSSGPSTRSRGTGWISLFTISSCASLRIASPRSCSPMRGRIAARR